MIGPLVRAVPRFAMVISVYADRRTHEVADIAGRLAHASAGLVLPAGGRVVLVGPRLLGNHSSGELVARSVLMESHRPQEVGPMLGDLAGRYAVSVVILSGAPNERVLAAFDASDRVLLLCDPSVASIRATQRAIKLCRSLGYGLDKTAVVLHDFAEDAPLVPAEAAAALKCDIYWSIPGHAAGDEARDTSFTRLAERLIAPT